MTGPTEAFALGKAAADAGYRLEAHDEVVSTNDLALGRARDGSLSRLWVVAHRQTGGRGRHGRVWASPSGNLYASLVLIDPCENARAPELGFVAGLALFEAASALTGLHHPRLSLKWPNDLLIDGAKCAGILLEGHRLANGAFALIIGIGVNVTQAPQEAMSLHAFAPDATPARLLPLLSDEFARVFADWAQAPSSSDAHFMAWGQRAHGIGSQVRVKLPKGDVVGLFHGLDRGRLILDTSEGRKTLDAGDLYVLDAGVASRRALA
ncbi:BirA family transcriptional regulator, biotin operon repressor / biotin-[acetyl-CoA-carboxylase] ligase [Rhizobiales bacterium GAS191]|jgi:BirA family biotin operon repressor/biotin-[acetyl-CoA-carboxylase] ligase|nr:BirA family transcriptional regulator, biotin operon repressor / biotin-[acetyl-CoA-carboxylase] ligase [Rhizobiales bacterium GAS113]SEC00513.1 BirA family transcriptional regulator, biotin operon repressor / biotin-[acetyl-CoA-carboxylase] ligase [Rhizobiales bacterium GAS188]SED21782.1 BirA family transcriptional regulator, biotin operon repressor / biotin-[acetyl-CoA-carboxylase] ligase [Rhizobiales bacterium GAS191]